jgi:hypothetical protein
MLKKNQLKKFYFLFLILSFFGFNKILFAQKIEKKDSITNKKLETARIIGKIKIDTIKVKHSPAKATLFSAVLPGMGQAYNKKYWKIPILYAGAGVLGYFIYFNNQRHLEFKDSYYAKVYNYDTRLDPFPRLSLESVTLNKNYFQRNRDFLVIISVLVYGLNLVDANVDAHLKDFDLSDNISLKLEPFSDTQFGTTGLNARLNFWATRR